MNARQYARLQQRPLTPLRKLVRAVLHAFGVPINNAQVADVAMRLYRPILGARDTNYRIAQAYLASQRLPSGIVIPQPRYYPMEALTQSIAKVSSELRVVGEPINISNRNSPQVIEMSRTAIEGPIARHALEPAREVVADIGEDEDIPGYGWARVLTGAFSCSFCAMLASRGPVYTSQAAAKGRGGSPLDLFHTPYVDKRGNTVGGFCDCEAVIVPRGKPWEGEDAWHKLNALWTDTTEDLSGKDARLEFRSTWEAAAKAGKTTKYLPESIQPGQAAA